MLLLWVWEAGHAFSAGVDWSAVEAQTGVSDNYLHFVDPSLPPDSGENLIMSWLNPMVWFKRCTKPQKTIEGEVVGKKPTKNLIGGQNGTIQTSRMFGRQKGWGGKNDDDIENAYFEEEGISLSWCLRCKFEAIYVISAKYQWSPSQGIYKKQCNPWQSSLLTQFQKSITEGESRAMVIGNTRQIKSDFLMAHWSVVQHNCSLVKVWLCSSLWKYRFSCPYIGGKSIHFAFWSGMKTKPANKWAEIQHLLQFW